MTDAGRTAQSRQNPWRRAWRRFTGNRLGWRSLQIFLAAALVSLFAEVLSNDRPLLVRYNGHYYVPLVQTLPETTFGGDFQTPTDFLDPFIQAKLAKPGNFALFPPNHYHYTTINYFSRVPDPAPPTPEPAKVASPPVRFVLVGPHKKDLELIRQKLPRHLEVELMCGESLGGISMATLPSRVDF